MLISRFEEIKMMDDETFGEFYSKMSDLRNSMVSLGKTVSNVKPISKILRSLPKCFRIKVTTIDESKDLEETKIEELVESLQTYELSLPPVKNVKTIALKASKKKGKVSSEEDSEKEEDVLAMLAKNFRRLMRNDRFKKKFFEKLKKALESLNLRKLKRKTPEAQDVLNAQALGI
jgi:histone H3/H4